MGSSSISGQSKYGLYNKNIRINNVNMGDDSNFVYAMTGYAAKEEDAENTTNANAIAWNQSGGELASRTGTIYGIYDMSGGAWERTAAIVNNGNDNLNNYGKAIMNALNNGKSSEYVTVYLNGETSGQSIDDASKSNYTANTKIYGDAIRETSTAGLGQTSWYSDYSYFVGLRSVFLTRWLLLGYQRCRFVLFRFMVVIAITVMGYIQYWSLSSILIYKQNEELT